MSETVPSPIVFVSYARADAEFPEHRDSLRSFIDDLSAKVAIALAVSLDDVSFIDVGIQAGAVFTDEIREALRSCRVGLALYSPNYFTRTWCGKEFQVLLDRSRPGDGGSGIVPVRWTKMLSDPPDCASRLQNDSDDFPPEYKTMGMLQLMSLRAAIPDGYQLALSALADRVVNEAIARRLGPLDTVHFDAVKSAWDLAASLDPHSHTRGNISKTCFAFVSHEGWDWAPYADIAGQVGAVAQKITGELGLKYEEISCDSSLPQKLLEANAGEVPTVIIYDPATPEASAYADLMRRYDTMYLLNCAALVPWKPAVEDDIDDDPLWIHLRDKICRQKVRNPPPHHEWRTVFSHAEFELRIRTLIEQIRSRLMKQLVSAPRGAGTPRRAADDAMSRDAAALGIATASIPILEGPSR